ncbi:uncharacterized protein LOC132194642 [Neocloeon triangulifer]|uniref:uncharacterized protein LOC132194642 n=1 Tax=Neocloeon triangulifer TaxID=2078957 RepID=UPI00286F4FEC|nr:uncharacterized protein LOC132194642 [Neocloeon triangulifer]
MSFPWSKFDTHGGVQIANALENTEVPATMTDPENLREMGNKFFKLGDYWKAISFYTKSLVKAAAGSKERGLAYANRSAVLLSLGYYDECISDAKIALQNNYPDSLVYKLRMRMAICHKALGREVEAQENLNAAIEMVKKQEMKSEVEEETIRSLIGQFAEPYKLKMPRFRVEHLELPLLSYGQNPQNSTISAALTIKQEGQNASLVANRRINAGDVLIIEEPKLSFNNSLENGGTPSWIHCCECLRICLNLQPSNTCSQTVFCSESCASQAWENWHKNECIAKNKIINDLLNGKIGENFAIKLESFSDLIHNVNFCFAIISYYGLDACTKFEARDEASANTTNHLGILSKIKECNVSIRLSSSFACIAAVRMVVSSFDISLAKRWALLRFLMKAARIAFGNLSPFLVATLLQMNNELCVCPNYRPTIGAGLFEGPIFLTTSCDPNTIIHFYQKKMVIRASRLILIGEEISNQLGVEYPMLPLEKRRQWYSEYVGPSFECKCRACRENWPTSDAMIECHKFVMKNCIYKTHLRPQFQSKIVEPINRAGGKMPLSMLTPENLELCQQIQVLYINQRYDDLQFNDVFDFIHNYFYVHDRKYFEAVDPGVQSPNKLDHCIPFKIFK